MQPPCEEGCNVPLYPPPEAPAEVPNDDFGGRAVTNDKPTDSSDKKIDLPHRSASWPVTKLIEFVKAVPFCTLGPGEAWLLVEHFERLLGEQESQLVGLQGLNEHYRAKLLQHNDL